MGCAPLGRSLESFGCVRCNQAGGCWSDLHPDDRAAADGDEAVGTKRDDHTHVCVVNRVVHAISALQGSVELRPRVVLDLLDYAPDLKEPVLVVGVGDRQCDPRLVGEVGELLPSAGMCQVDPRAIPGASGIWLLLTCCIGHYRTTTFLSPRSYPVVAGPLMSVRLDVACCSDATCWTARPLLSWCRPRCSNSWRVQLALIRMYQLPAAGERVLGAGIDFPLSEFAPISLRAIIAT
jgi:hypothetical protein